MEVDTRHGIHITEKAGSYYMSSQILSNTPFLIAIIASPSLQW